MSTELNKRQKIAANLIGLGGRPSEVAEKLSVSKETISRWQAQEEFEAEADRVTKALLLDLLDERVALIDACHRVIKDILLGDDTSNSAKGSIALKYLNAVGAKMNAYNVLTQRLSYLSNRRIQREGDNPMEGMPDIYYDLVNLFK
jgi:uncharacterized protein YjcR